MLCAQTYDSAKVNRIQKTSALHPQVLVVRGVNPTGQCIIASELISLLPASMPATKMEEIVDFHRGAGECRHGGINL